MIRTKKELEFIKHVKLMCKIYGVKCSLRNTKSVKLIGESVRCSGWFDESVPELVVSMNRPDWIEILAHEYSHLTQWVEQTELWKNSESGLRKLWGWLEGENHRNMNKHINVARDLELDNEKRTVEIIKRFGLKINTSNYIKRANSYIQFYNYIKISRKWSNPKNTPYNSKRLMNAMSPNFDMNYEILTPEIKKIFIEEKI